MPLGESLPISALVPHGEDAILLERVLAHDRESTTAEAIVGRRSWLRQRDGSVASWLSIEYMAQCVAVHEGILAREDGRVLPMGHLVRVTSLRLSPSCFRADERIRVRVRRMRGRAGLGVFSHAGAIFREGDDAEAAPVAEGRISIVVNDPVAS